MAERDWSVLVTPAYFAAMALEHRVLKRRAEAIGPSAADYDAQDARASISMGVASLAVPITQLLVKRVVPKATKGGNVALGAIAVGATAVTIADRVAAYEVAAKEWYQRYRRPFWVAETSNLGLDVDQGIDWLDSLVAGVDRLRDDGLPAQGICWYSRGDQYDWDSALTEPVGRVTTVGLFDEHRMKRPVADAFARLASARR